MKIIADQDIPYIKHYFGQSGELVLLPGRDINQQTVKDADVLLVRSITSVNQSLLEHTKVRFVASPTTGYDHFDIAWLNKSGIAWSVAPGCNARAVVEYVISVIAALQKRVLLPIKNGRAGVVGVGVIGRKIVHILKILGYEVIQCDPLRAENEKDFISTPLSAFSDLDLVTIHTPLTRSGMYPTYHLIDKIFLKRQKNNCVLINTARGSVIDFADLQSAGAHLIWCLDVWDNEPYIPQEILDNTTIATPHMAGYTVHSRYRGIEMIYQAALQNHMIVDSNISSLSYPEKKLVFNDTWQDWRDVVLHVYNPFDTTQVMKNTLIANNAKSFDELRKNSIKIADRYEYPFISLVDAKLSREDESVLHQLGFGRF